MQWQSDINIGGCMLRRKVSKEVVISPDFDTCVHWRHLDRTGQSETLQTRGKAKQDPAMRVGVGVWRRNVFLAGRHYGSEASRGGNSSPSTTRAFQPFRPK